MNKISLSLVMILGLMMQQAYAQQSKLIVKIPFEDQNGTIILTVKLNEYTRPLRLLFDTGADGMAVSQSLADSIGLKVSRKRTASVIGGDMDISISNGNTVHMDGFLFKNQNIAIFKEMPKETDGVIGNIIVRHYVTKIDYDKKELSLYHPDGYVPEQDVAVVPFTMPAGLFIISGNLSIVSGRSYQGNFVFDTGASYNLICFRPFVKQNKLLVSGFKAQDHGSTVSMGMTTPTFTGIASSFSFSGMKGIKNFAVTLMAGGGQNESWNPGFDGSIGVGLIARYNFTINMSKKEIYFIPNKNYRNENI